MMRARLKEKGYFMATFASQETDSARLHRYNQAAILLSKWIAEDSDYDERIGELLDQELISSPMQCHDDGEPVA
jgi:hypothetical protein